jgi:predicted DNA-binding protein (UPF0251 family)
MSPAPKKPRNCNCKLKSKAFKPTGIPMCDLKTVQLYQDELEALKLCDREGMTQLEASKLMHVSRVTVQRILASARSKVAEAITNCKVLVFEDELH